MSNEHLNIYVSYVKTIVLMSKCHALHRMQIAMVAFRAGAGKRAQTTNMFPQNVCKFGLYHAKLWQKVEIAN